MEKYDRKNIARGLITLQRRVQILNIGIILYRYNNELEKNSNSQLDKHKTEKNVGPHPTVDLYNEWFLSHSIKIYLKPKFLSPSSTYTANRIQEFNKAKLDIFIKLIFIFSQQQKFGKIERK